MNAADILAKLTPIFRDVFDDERIVVTPAMSAADIPEWDSLNHIRIVVAAEKAFGVKFTAAEIGDLANVGEFAALIRAKAR